MTTKKHLAACTLYVLSALILWSYAALRVVPILGTYLGQDRVRYSFITAAAALAGFLFFWLARRGRRVAFLKYLLAFFSVLLLVGWPLMALWRSAKSFRGFDWALDTLLIGLLPVLILAAGLMICAGKRIIALGASILFSLLAVFQLLALLKIAPQLGMAFSSARSSAVAILVAIFVVAALFAWINYRYYSEGRKKS